MDKHNIISIIAQKHAQKAVIRHFLDEGSELFGTSVLSFDNFITESLKLPSNIDYFWHVVDVILKHKTEFKVLYKSLNHPSAVDEIIQFIREMAEENIDIDALPSQSSKDKELKLLIKRIDPTSYPKYRSLQAFMEQTNFENVKLVPYIQGYAEHKRIEHMLENGAKLLELPQRSNQYNAYYAKNPRMEAYGVVQMIAQSKTSYDKTLIVCLDSEIIEPLTNYLKQLEIPYTYTSSKPLLQVRQFIDCLEFAIEPSLDNLVRILKSSLIQDPNILQILKYIEIAHPSLDAFTQPFKHLSETLYENDIWDKRSIRQLLEIEAKSEQLRPSLLPLLELKPETDIQILVKQVYACFAQYCTDASALNLIRTNLQNHLTHLNTLNQIPYLIHQLEQIQDTESSEQGIQIVGLQDAMIPFMEQTFIMGCTQKNYPQYPVHRGFFDEDYFNNCIQDDPSQRYQWYISQLEQSFELANTVTFTYSVGNYEGKGSSLSFEIEDFLKRKAIDHFEPLPLQEAEVSMDRAFKLDPELSKQLFFKDADLFGSVSSFESFFRCPYQYYLKAGLKLYVQKPFEIDNSLMGTIAHAVFEHSVRKAHKEYANFGQRHLDELVDPLFNDLKKLYPSQVSKIDTIHVRAKELLSESLNLFDQIEHATDYEPMDVEVEFKQTLELDANKRVQLKGFIDRVDQRDAYVRIIDYKSSSKSLNAKSVLSGNKLQLPTYAYFGSNIFNKEVSGIYYASFGQKNTISIKPSTYAKTKGLTLFTDDDHQADYIESRQWEGYTFDDVENQDEQARFIKGFKRKGDKLETKTVQFELLRQALYELYAQLYDELSCGNIAKDCVEGACEYCDYKAICQFKGEAKKERNRTSIASLNEGAQNEAES